jgi:hypothetical protein
MTTWRVLTQRHLSLAEIVMTFTGRPAYLSESGHNPARDRWRR